MAHLAAEILSRLPLIYFAGAALTWQRRQALWPLAQALALGAVVVVAATGAWELARHGQLADPLGVLMALLVSTLGAVIVRYSRRYLEGEPEQARYLAALLLTLGAALAVVLSHHLGWLVLAWTASSLGLHPLLTFYRHRRAAQIVAHKKFLASRLAELCLLAAAGLIYTHTGTLQLDGIAQALAQTPHVGAAVQTAAVLIALAVIFKSAQLPVHGWLIQVMEAPTPISALLHAGIVNIGGFVLIRLAPVMAHAPLAQTLLVVVGSLSAALAGLVMMTRISIKVRLAWSTCAQMGFMLMECGLGLYELALLHLLAHSLYKAYAFLSAGETVLQVRSAALSRPLGLDALSPAGRVLRGVLALPLAAVLVAGVFAASRLLVPESSLSIVAAWILALGLAPLLWSAAGARALVLGALRIVALAALYTLWHLGCAHLLPAAAAPGLALSAWAGLTFATLYAVQLALSAYPSSAFAQRFYPWAYAGFYLDEYFTRLSFRLWPARLPEAPIPTF